MSWYEPKYMVPFFLIATAAVLNIGIIRGESSLTQYYDLKKSRDILKDTVTTLQSENANVKQEIDKLKSSPDYARKVLKDKYHVISENEKIVFFAD